MKKLAFIGTMLMLSGLLAACQFQFFPTPAPAPTAETTPIPATPRGRPTRTPLPALNSPGGPPLRQLAMFGTNDGWGLIDHALLLTHDGGTSWFSVPMPQGQVDSTSVAFFVNAKTIYLVVPSPDGKVGQLYFSKDGGGTWKISPVPFIRGQMTFFDKTGYFLVSTRTGPDSMKSTIFGTEDNGLTWKQIFPAANQDPGNDIPETGFKTGFAFIDSQHGWLGLSNQPQKLVLYHTSNGGRNWTPQNLQAPQNIASLVTTTLPPIFFPGNTNDGMLPVIFTSNDNFDGNLVFYATGDGGANWWPGGPVAGGQTYTFLDPKHGWAWGKRGLYVTKDGAKTWQPLPVAFGKSEQASNIQFVNANTGWLVSTDSNGRVRLYNTRDGGNTWVAINP